MAEMKEGGSGAVLSVRFSRAELDQIQSQAAKAGMKTSAFVRQFVLSQQTGGWFGTSTTNQSSPHGMAVDVFW